jgi:TldD protein
LIFALLVLTILVFVLLYYFLLTIQLKLDSGVGVCGKDGQSVPVGVGQPSLKIDELTVGGTQV